MKKTAFLLPLLLCLLLANCGTGPVYAPPPAETTEPPPSLTPEAVPQTLEPARDAAELRLREMTLEEKAYQMILLCAHELGDVEAAAAAGVGGVCLYADAFEGKDREEVLAMTAALQDSAPIPLLLAVDEEGGIVCRVSLNKQLRFANFDSPRRLYERGGWALIESDAVEKSQLLLGLGLNVNLAPVADVPLDRSNYIYPRAFSTDAGLTAEFVSRVVTVMKQQGIGCTLKHFPGYGGSEDTHTGLAYDERPYEAFTEGDFLPFLSGIEAGADAVLVSHNIVECMDPERPASLSGAVHEILRRELGFEGVVLCDDLHMDAIGEFTGGQNAAVQAVLAGNDLICCGDYEDSAQAICAAVLSGEIPMEQIDASVLRILRWKLALGLDISPK